MRQIPRNLSNKVSLSVFVSGAHFFSAIGSQTESSHLQMHLVWLVKWANTHVHMPANTPCHVVNMALIICEELQSWVLNYIVSVSLSADLTAPGSREKHTQTQFFEILPHTCVFTLNDNTQTTFPLKPAQRLEWVDLWENWLWEAGNRKLEKTFGHKWPIVFCAVWSCVRWLRVRWYCWPLKLVNW